MKTARYAALAVAFLTPAVWLLLLLSCLRFGADVCQPVNLAAVPLAIGALVLLPIGLVYVERARRRAAKGMWLRVAGAGWGRTLAHGVRAVWGGPEESPAIVGVARFTRRRWLVTCPNGQTVSVDRRRFWHWLEEVDRLQRTLPPGQSAVSMRRWKGRKFEGVRLSEGDVLAFREILKAIRAVEYRTKDARSMYYVVGEGAVWGRVEEFEKMVESEGY